MKKILTATIILVSAIAFAGPEEHKDNQTCYGLEQQRAKQVDSQIPLEICLEKATLDFQSKKLNVYSYFQPQLFKDVDVTSVSRFNSNTFIFKAYSFLDDKWDSQKCQAGETLSLVIKGFANSITGESDITKLRVYVVHTTTTNTCGPKSSSKIYEYLIK